MLGGGYHKKKTSMKPTSADCTLEKLLMMGREVARNM
jgi:hypothetical protein